MPAKSRTPKGKPAAPRSATKKTAAKKEPTRPSGGSADLAAAVRALERVADSLHFTHESFVASLLRLPQADDYEPLTDPLRRLVSTVPSLLQALEGHRAAPAVAPPTPPTAPTHVTSAATPAQPALPRAATAPKARAAVAAARDHLATALELIPRADDYTPVARNLRALASVSPSLMAWLEEVPSLSAPLAEAVAGLRDAVAELELALDLLDQERGSPVPQVKVVVRGA